MKASVFFILGVVFAFACASSAVHAEVRLPAIFGNHMVLQRDQPVPVWGWAEPGEQVTVAIGDQRHVATADDNGRWRVELTSMPAGGPHVMTVSAKNELRVEDVLFGEVWLCSGQSNMAWPVNAADDADLEKLTAKFPRMRLISIPAVGVQEPQEDFQGQWEICSPESVANFSAVGYFFGRQLHQTLDVPIGLIDNAWGGSSVEAWISRDVLNAEPSLHPLMNQWREMEATYDYDQQVAEHKLKMEIWEKESILAEKQGTAKPPRPRGPGRNAMRGQHRPGNLYCGVLHPIIGYRISGAIWYQGESNASRAHQYRTLFPMMIQLWRDRWNQGDFSFYWVQLADFKAEKSEPGDSEWAELREAQSMTMHLPNTGEAVIIDLGEANDIHPRNKQVVAKRLARWALANDYGLDIACRSPRYRSSREQDGKMLVTFDFVGSGLDTFDVNQPLGFTLAGDDKSFLPAQARIVDKNVIEVWSEQVPEPVAVRYAWADNPVCNVQNKEGLPLTPFRSDDWPGVTRDKKTR